MIQERLKRSNLIMLVVAVAVAGGAGPAAGDHLPAASGADHAGSAFYELAVPWPDGLLHPLCGGGRARSAEKPAQRRLFAAGRWCRGGADPVARPRRALACWRAWLYPSVLSATRCKSTAAR